MNFLATFDHGSTSAGAFEELITNELRSVRLQVPRARTGALQEAFSSRRCARARARSAHENDEAVRITVHSRLQHAANMRALRPQRVIAVFRHGDRSPAFNPWESFDGATAAEVANHRRVWSHKAAIPPAQAQQWFPVHNANSSTFDSDAYPLQWLTQLGWEQAACRGRMLRSSYADLLAEAGKTHSPKGCITARASNYVRTQLTAMSVLNGLIGDNIGRTEEAVVPIIVKPASEDDIAVFESGNGLTDAMYAVFRSDVYREREAEMVRFSRQLIAAVPYFRPRQSSLAIGSSAAATSASASASDSLTESGAPAPLPPISSASVTASASAAAPAISSGPATTTTLHSQESMTRSSTADHGIAESRFQWIRAYDVFTSHRSHGLSAPWLTSVSALEHLTQEHLLWRFRTLFSIPHVLRLAVAGLCSEFAATLGDIDSPPGRLSPPLLSLLSGHDVTLLPALYALVAASRQVCARFPSGGGSWVVLSADRARMEVPWPVYTATLTLELRSSAPTDDPSGAVSSEPLVLWTLDNEIPSVDGNGVCPPAEPAGGGLRVSGAEQRAEDQLLQAASACVLSLRDHWLARLQGGRDNQLSNTIVQAAAADASAGLPEHLRQKLGHGGVPDTVQQLKGSMRLSDLQLLADLLREAPTAASA